MTPLRPYVPAALLAAIAAIAAACSEPTKQQPAGPVMTPPPLRPMIVELNEAGKTLAAPADAVQKELRELADVALQLVEADTRTASRAERALLDHDAAWWVLEPALAHDSVAIRRRAAWLCGQSGQTVLQLPLLLRLKYELDGETIVWVADALQRLGNDTGLAWLDSAIGSSATAQQAGQLAIEALRARGVKLSEQPTWAEIQQHLRERIAAWHATGVPSLPDVKPPEAKQLAARLSKHLATTQDIPGNTPGNVPGNGASAGPPRAGQLPLRPIDDARFVMTRAGRLCVPMLVHALGASEHYLRTMALQVLTELGTAAAAAGPAVMPLLGDPLTAAYAVRALGEIGAMDAAPYLRTMLGHFDTELRAAAAQALGLLRDEASRPALRERLADAKEAMDVRVNAAFALRCFGDDAEAETFLAEREAKKDYHEPMLARLRERLAALKR
jgi:HEAT repeat protein